MYKMIQLTDKELEVLHQILGWYLTEKQHKDQPNYQNAHIILRHLNGRLAHKNTNEISFFGK